MAAVVLGGVLVEARRHRRQCLAWVVAVTAASHLARADDAQIVQAAQRSTIFVEATVNEPTGRMTTETGTGFICSSSGYALTANHVIQTGGAKVFVRIGSNTGERLAAFLTGASGAIDAALIQLPTSHAPYQPVKFGDPALLSQGDHLVAVGFPLGFDYSTSSGTLSNKGGQGGLWQISIPLSYGNSGGPILNTAGQTVGMVRGGIAQAQQINYMMPMNLLSGLVMQCGVPWPPSGDPLPAQPVAPTRQPLRPGPNCHEITDYAPGFPPTYTRRLVCD
jgi:S1-C subfamily serine protease